ncbi:MAG: preprotein translocase subunit SecG [Paracoccus sp. (in: a-proteobacteria)]|nr:preprotein translocase subunit SecG [Paracoccus sp. (in: a-proteobacteria)]
MENVVLTVHLILALLLIVVVLLQRSEGGGLGIGGGGGGNVMTGRQAANAMTRATWILAAAFLVTSITLTVLAARGVGGGSVMDQIGITPGATGTEPASDLPVFAPPPPASGTAPTDGPMLPPAAGAPVPAAPGAPAPAAPAPAAPAPSTPPAAPAPATPPAAPAPATGN